MFSVAPGCRALVPLTLALLTVMTAAAQQTQQPPAQDTKPEAPPAQPAKPETPPAQPAKQNPLGPLGPPPSTETTYGKGVVFEARYWLVKSNPLARQTGGDATENFSFRDDIGGSANNNRPSILVGIPTKHGNKLWFSYAETTYSGGGTSTRALNFDGQSYDANTLLNENMKLRNIKLSWDYLTYPAPPRLMKKWQFKTLWEVQAVEFSPTVTSTILTTDSTGAIIDNGNTTSQSKFLLLPSIGAGIDTQPAKNVDFSIKGSGFILPSHRYIYDMEAKLGVRVKHAEIVLGYRRLYASAGSSSDQYFRAGMSGPYGGLAWHF
jgi:hypothetical protein